jgi:hypothetical protein
MRYVGEGSVMLHVIQHNTGISIARLAACKFCKSWLVYGTGPGQVLLQGHRILIVDEVCV